MARERDEERRALEGMLARSDPERYLMVESWPEEIRADFYDRLGRAYWAALERGIMYGTDEERQARTRAAVRGQIRANKREQADTLPYPDFDNGLG